MSPNEGYVSREEGSVAALWRYPVKSMGGETLSSLTVNDRGAVGDRILALRMVDGKLASGKTTTNYRHVEGLLQFRATMDHAGLVSIHFPDGRIRAACDPAVNDELSSFLKTRVELAFEGQISHHDVAALHVLSEAALTLASAGSPGQIKLDVRRFRPNVVLTSAEVLEDTWIGQIVKIGDTLLVKFDYPTERCVMITQPQAELSSSPWLLRILAKDGKPYVGVYAHVIRPGTINVGDKVQAVSSRLSTNYHRLFNGVRRRIKHRLEITSTKVP